MPFYASKCFNVRTTNPDALRKLLTDNNISFKETKEKYRDFTHLVKKHRLLPYEDLELTNRLWIFEMSLKDKPAFHKITNTRETKLTSISYERDNPPNLNFEFPSITHKYPIYIVSYNRFQPERRKTLNYLEEANIPYYLVVQQREYEDYNAIPKNCCLGIIQSPNTDEGSTLQRNTAWEHATTPFWLLDDNINTYYYYTQLKKTKVVNPIVFVALERFMDTHENIGIIGHNYASDCHTTTMKSPFTINSKVFSSMLINKPILKDIRFRLKYNEDIDLVLQVLCKHIHTIGFNQFCADKCTTGTIKGGNTSSIYSQDKSTLSHSKLQDKVNCLMAQWEDFTKLGFIKQETIHKDNRPHHKVDYTKICKHIKFRDDLVVLNTELPSIDFSEYYT